MLASEPESTPVDLSITDVESLKPVSGIDSEVRAHLRRVFAALTVTTGFGALGSAFYVYTHLPVLVSFLVTLGLIIYLSAAPELSTGNKPSLDRVAALLVFGFFQGCSIGALVEQSLKIDPNIVVTAFVGTVVIFGCFAASAIYAKRRTFLFMGGYLLSCLSNLVLLVFVNIFFRVPIVDLIWLYGGLFLFCGFVLYDTNLIIEKAHQGSRDFVRHALELFLDFVNIFVRILIILSRRRD